MDITAHAKSTTERGFVGAHLVGALGHPPVAAFGRFRPLVETGTTRISYKIAALGQLRRTVSFSTHVREYPATAPVLRFAGHAASGYCLTFVPKRLGPVSFVPHGVSQNRPAYQPVPATE